MKKMVISATLIALLVMPGTVFAGKKCTGSNNCTTCTTCTGCKHCAKNGGTCGVCKPKSKKSNSHRYRHFSIVVHDEYGKYIDLAANVIGPKKGISYQELGGKFYLDVTADGNWYVDIVQIKR